MISLNMHLPIHATLKSLRFFYVYMYSFEYTRVGLIAKRLVPAE